MSVILKSGTSGNTAVVDASGNLQVVIAGGGGPIGSVAIDQTTPGTTNGVQVNAPLPAGANSIGTVVLGAGTASVGAAQQQVATDAVPTLQVLRTPNVFNTASVLATATGNSAVWTPASGKKFRLMRFQITAAGLAATVAATITVSFQDSASGITIGTYDVAVPAVANVVSGVSSISQAWVDLGNGFLSAAANNVLNFNISAAGAGTVGSYRINVAGNEE